MTAGAVSTSGQSRDLPAYEVSRTATPIKVDGKLDDAVWANAPSFREFRLNLDGSPAPYKTEARALYDDTFLYFSFAVATTIFGPPSRRVISISGRKR